ncbi:Ger(x)C family spore germination protein [Paenibacillus sp. FSL P4-0184]|uniref:Ger(x)C family spore germination protein n=1 Tax=Paenibacillus sp. FSL P4-0184 TaxID=2921632 RepID=UPI0030F680CC
MQSKRLFFIGALLTCLMMSLSLTGCWDSVELNRRAIVSGVAIDRGPTEAEKYVLSFQVIIADEISGENARGTSPVVVYKGSGRSMFEALANASRQTARFLSLGHIRVIVISEKFAREGIKDMMDMLERESETRLTSLLFISKGQPAIDSMTTMTTFGRIPANDLIEKLQTTSKQFGYNYRMEVDDVVRDIQFPGGGPVINGVLVKGEVDQRENNDNLKNIEPESIITVTEFAAFKGDKLIGWLKGDEAAGTGLLKNKITQIPVVVSIGENEYVSFIVYLSQVHIHADAKDPEHPVITINITEQAGLKESPNTLDLTDPKVLNNLSELLEQSINDKIHAAVSAARSLKSDYLGFGEVVERENPRGWKSVKDHWDSIFATCEIRINVDVVIRHTDMRSDSFQSKKK